MNWIFEAYSNVYSAAMMQDGKHPSHVAGAKKAGLVSKLQAKLFKH
jgi:hypothetical protein